MPPAVRVATKIHDFVTQHRLREKAAELDTNPAFPTAEFAAMGEAHLLGLTIPSADGGRGMRLPEAGRVLAELAGLSGSVFAKISLQPEFTSVILEHGRKELVDAFFRPLVQGELLIGNQVTEPNAGSDVASLTTKAERTGNGYIVRGQKSQAAFAADAAAAVVYVRTSAATKVNSGITALVIDQKSPKIQRTVVGDLGERWMRRGTVTYHGVSVPSERRVGEEGMGFSYLKDELRRERALLAAIYLGVARDSWAETSRYVHERRAFGDLLSHQEAVAFPLAEDGVQLSAAELLVNDVLERLDAGRGTDADAAGAKWLATRVALDVLDHAVQFHGGRGYSKEFPHEQRWRDVRSGALAHGTSEILRLIVARQMFPRTAVSA